MPTTTTERTTAAVRVAVFVAALAVVFTAAFGAGRVIGAPDASPVTEAPAHPGSGDGH